MKVALLGAGAGKRLDGSGNAAIGIFRVSSLSHTPVVPRLGSEGQSYPGH
jgi:hypothetical protein